MILDGPQQNVIAMGDRSDLRAPDIQVFVDDMAGRKFDYGGLIAIRTGHADEAAVGEKGKGIVV